MNTIPVCHICTFVMNEIVLVPTMHGAQVSNVNDSIAPTSVGTGFGLMPVYKLCVYIWHTITITYSS